MKQTVTKYKFERAFKDAGRSEQFSYGALNLLFDYFEEYEESGGNEIELDVIGICCEYAEDNMEDIRSSYGLDDDADEGDVINFLQENTQYIGKTATGLVYAAF